MNCFEIREKLIDYLCREVNALEANFIETHISDCPACRDELEFLKSICDVACCDERLPSFNEAYWESFVVEVRHKIEVDKKKVLPRWLVPAVATVVVIVIGVGYMLIKPKTKPAMLPTPIVADSGLIKNIQALSPSEIESIIKQIVDRQEINKSLWELRRVEPDRFRQLVKEGFLLERTPLNE